MPVAGGFTPTDRSHLSEGRQVLARNGSPALRRVAAGPAHHTAKPWASVKAKRLDSDWDKELQVARDPAGRPGSQGSSDLHLCQSSLAPERTREATLESTVANATPFETN